MASDITQGEKGIPQTTKYQHDLVTTTEKNQTIGGFLSTQEKKSPLKKKIGRLKL